MTAMWLESGSKVRENKIYFPALCRDAATRRAAARPAMGMLLAGLTNVFVSFAARGQDDPNEIPQLRPPHAEIPPTFFEQHGGTVVILGLALVAALALVIWLLTRPKPPVVVSPEAEARKALNALPAQAADGATLSRISQILRRYVRRGFDLAEHELTTTEFCRVIAGEPKIGPELAAALGEFLRDLDVRKFAPAATSTEIRAVAVALALIDKAEARREHLRAAASAATGKPA